MYSSSLKDKIPPHNPEAEQAVLGAMLLEWSSISKVTDHHVHPETFFSKRNALIFKAILELYTKGQTGDIITLKDELASSGELEEAGGALYLSELTNAVPTSANIEYYANIVIDCFRRRELIKISSEIIASAYDETKESRLILEEAQNKVLMLADINQTQAIQSMLDVVPPTFDIIVARTQNQNAYTGIASGIDDLDNLTSGFQNSELIIIGARPSIGKTALALSMIQNIAVNNKIPTAFFSLEMPYQAIGMRLLSQVSKVDSKRIRSGLLSEKDLCKLQDACAPCYEAPLFIVDSPSTKLWDLHSLSRRMVLEHGIKIIFIDYISLITVENTKLERHLQVAEISRSLKSIARELHIPVVALSQLNRDTEKTRHKPTLADIRESGSIEQDADVVIFIHRDREKQDADGEEKTPGIESELILAKQRNGPIGTVKTLFFPSYTKFENMSRAYT